MEHHCGRQSAAAAAAALGEIEIGREKERRRRKMVMVADPLHEMEKAAPMVVASSAGLVIGPNRIWPVRWFLNGRREESGTRTNMDRSKWGGLICICYSF